MKGVNVTFEHLALRLELITNTNKSEWELANMTVSYKTNSSEEQTDTIIVAPRRGYFLNQTEPVCAKVGTATIGYCYYVGRQGCKLDSKRIFHLPHYLTVIY